MNSKLLASIEEVEEFISETKSIFLENREEFLSQKEKVYAISMTLFTVLNATIEVGEEIISLEKFMSAKSYKNIFEILSNKNIISIDLANFLKNSIQSRNMIAHQYGSFNKEEVYELTRNIDKFQEFIDCVKKYYKDKTK